MSHGDLPEHVARHGFEVIDLIDIQAPAGTPPGDLVDPAWARDDPAEQIWKARKR